MPYPIQEIDFSDLSTADRLQLAQALLDGLTLDGQPELLTADQMEELDRRLATIEDGTMPFESWEMLRERLLLHR